MLYASSAHACAFKFTSGAFLRPARHLSYKRRVDMREEGKNACEARHRDTEDLSVFSCLIFPIALFRTPLGHHPSLAVEEIEAHRFSDVGNLDGRKQRSQLSGASPP